MFAYFKSHFLQGLFVVAIAAVIAYFTPNVFGEQVEYVNWTETNYYAESSPYTYIRGDDHPSCVGLDITYPMDEELVPGLMMHALVPDGAKPTNDFNAPGLLNAKMDAIQNYPIMRVTALDSAFTTTVILSDADNYQTFIYADNAGVCLDKSGIWPLNFEAYWMK